MTHDHSEYQRRVDAALRRVEDGLSEVDPDSVDLVRSGDVLTLTFAGGKKCILNTQRPTRQLWLAAGAKAWHFDFDDARGAWTSDKPPHDELYATLALIVREAAGVSPTF